MERSRRIAHRTKSARLMNAAAYLAIAGAGLTIILTDFPRWYTIMGWWCLVGGGLSALGSLRGKWTGEYLGLPLVGSAMLTLALLTYRDSWGVVRWMSLPSILLLAAYGAILLGRWADVSAVGRAARRQSHVDA